MKIFVFFVFAVMINLFGCIPNTISHFASDKIVGVYPDGTPLMSDRYDENGSILYEGDFSFDEQMDLFERRFKESGRKKILIYAFGGMNDMAFEIERSEELIKAIWETSDYYPMTLAWESNLFDCYLDHLFFIRNGIDVGGWGILTSPFYLVKDIGGALVRLPANFIKQTATVVTSASDFDFVDLTEENAKRLQDHPMTMYLGGDSMSTIDQSWARIAYVAGAPFRFLTTTLIDGIAGSSWSVMQARARSAFGAYTVLNYNENEYLESFLEPPKGAYSILCERLIAMQEKDSSIEITLIGHSMGPFIINEILSKYGELEIKNIVYLSAATSVKTSCDVIAPYLRAHPESRFYNLTCHPRAESYEMMAYGILPQGSALEWITLYFTNSVDCDDFAIGLWGVAFACLPRHMVGCEHQVVNKSFGINDPITNVFGNDISRPECHTEFSEPDIHFWEESFWNVPASVKDTHWLNKIRKKHKK